MRLLSYMQEKKKIIDEYLDQELPPESQKPDMIHRSIRYSVLNGGKRIRPILTIMTAELLGQSYERVLPTAAGIELIHTFSLVHDDLPCMDNDDYRRGKPTNHKVFGEAMAVLTGDALLVMGLDFICRNREMIGVTQESVNEVLQFILKMLGTTKMLGGQVDDISWHKKNGQPDYIKDIYSKKTSALICASLKSGAILSQANKKEIDALESYGENIGLAFQITDDLLDLTQDKKADNQPTYPDIFGIEKSREAALQYGQQAKECISFFGDQAYLFAELADLIVKREK